jgi:glycerol-3-phosphate dehydrogenase
VPQDGVRVTFVVPWYRMLLLGTTDTPFEGDPNTVGVDEEDVAQVLREAAVAIRPALADRGAVRASFAGLRVLPAGPGESVSARRETVYTVGPAGMLSVAGGKLTTYRKIALDALERLRPELGLRTLDRRPWGLPGASAPREPLRRDLDPDVREHLLHLYGGRAHDVVAAAGDDPSLLERLHPDGPDIAAQALHAVRHEWATTVDDVLRRRTTVALRGLDDDRARAAVSRLL